MMRQFYERGDLPVSVDKPATHPSGGSLIWEVDAQLLDYDTYLPMFFGGLVELEEPYALFARRGTTDMLEKGDDVYVAAATPLVISELRNGLADENPTVCIAVVRGLQQLIQVGKQTRKVLLPFMKKLLPCLRRLLLKQSWQGYSDGSLDQECRSGPNLGILVEETLQLFHRYGGKEALKCIKSICPTYAGVV